MATTYNRGPKRRIERVRSTLSHSCAVGVTTKTLHTAEDAKTLIRMRISGACRCSAVAPSINEMMFQVAVAPNGANVADAPSLSEALDADCPTQLLAEGVTMHAGYDAMSFEVDSKAMRKLQPGDTIKWRDVSDSTDLSINAIVTLWFKE